MALLALDVGGELGQTPVELNDALPGARFLAVEHFAGIGQALQSGGGARFALAQARQFGGADRLDARGLGLLEGAFGLFADVQVVSLAGLGDIWKRTVAGTSPVTGGTKGKPGTTLADYIGEGKLYGTPEDYIRASIYNPGEILVGGYGPNMPHFKGQVNDVGIDALIGMMRHLEDFDAAGKYTKTLPSELAEESGGTEPEENPAG